jgi:hypothetical protein
LPPPAVILIIAIQFVLCIVSNFPGPKIGIKELSMKFVDKVFIIEELMFTITKWLEIAGDSKIVNLKPVLNPIKLKEKGRWVK